MDEYTVVILVSLVGFALLAAILLVPVYRFLKKEEKISEQWTVEALQKRSKEKTTGKSEPEQSSSAQSEPTQSSSGR
ncbi:MAG: hypothetical protein E2O84_00710 [Bacteroidetes bacterium]|nr:MAG: hypothetical protein E2O84_00710 [Bacteroidota bacterium]